MYSKMIGSTLALGLCLLGSSGQVRAQAADESAQYEWFPSPKVALLNCGANAMALSGGYLNETDGTLSTVGWFEVPAGANSGGLPMPSDKFFVRIESEDPATEADSDTLVVTFPDIPTRELCARVPGFNFNIGESADGVFVDALDGTAASVPANCEGDGYEMLTYYEIDASEFSNEGEFGVECDAAGCKIIEASEDNPVPVGFRECPDV